MLESLKAPIDRLDGITEQLKEGVINPL